MINWLSDNAALGGGNPTAALEVRWSASLGATLAIALIVVLPALYLAFGLRRRARRRRA